MRRATVNFPLVTSCAGARLEKAVLRELNGRDQEQLLEQKPLSTIVRMLQLLDSVVDFGDEADQNEKTHLLSSLPVGDFVALVLELRRLTFGDLMQCLITCPVCKQEMAANIPTARLIQKPLTAETKNFEKKIRGFTLKLRPITCADLTCSAESKRSPLEQLARRCILECVPAIPETLDSQFLAEISAELAELDPQADILLYLECPNCSHKFQAPFYPEDFFLREIDAKKAQLEGEVHWLAFNYHWSENEILALPLSKRRRYVDLINMTLSGEAIS
jgi:hypothetical protein